jgi:SET domain-containing protein
MLLVKTSLRKSDIHGFGCFAEEKINKGQVVWVFDDRIDVRVTVDELKQLPESARDFYRIYGYSEMYQGEQVIVLCGDHSKHMNHSLEPNLTEGGDEGELNVALCDIEVGEELTCNYYNFDLLVGEKL